MAPKPSDITVIFVHGAWHGPEVWSLVSERLQAKGFNVDAVRLPSVGATPPLDDFQPDVDVIRKHITKAVDAGQHVVMVAHSYGGVPTTEAVHDLDYASRRAAGLPGGVVHLIYCCAFLIPAGKSLQDALGGGLADWCKICDNGKELRAVNAEQVFYNDLPEDIAKEYTEKLKLQSLGVFGSELRHAMWQKVPSTYIYCLQDNAIPIFVQEMMVKEFAGGAGVEFRTVTLDASHSPFLSKPEETAAAIEKAAMLDV